MIHINRSLLSVIAVSLVLGSPVVAKTFDAGTEDSAEFAPAQVVSNPTPQLSDEMRHECFKSCCIARFMIAADGATKVRLVSSSGSDEIDDITLQTLRRWKFKPAMLDGKPVPSTRRIKVEFQVD